MAKRYCKRPNCYHKLKKNNSNYRYLLITRHGNPRIFQKQMPILPLTRLSGSVMVCCPSITAQVPGKQDHWQEKGRLQASCSLWNTHSKYMGENKACLVMLPSTKENKNTSTPIKYASHSSAEALPCLVSLDDIWHFQEQEERAMRTEEERRWSRKNAVSLLCLVSR